MSEFDPSEPAVLHDRLSDTMVPWTGEMKDHWVKHAARRSEDVIAWNGRQFDGWGEALGG